MGRETGKTGEAQPMPQVTTRRVMDLEYPAEARVVGDIREKFEEFVKPLQLSPDDLDDLKMALSEACGNAICHGSPNGAASRIRVRCELDSDHLRIEITDQGVGFHPKDFDLPREEEWKASGRGLFLMQALMDAVEFEATPVGTRVRLARSLRR